MHILIVNIFKNTTQKLYMSISNISLVTAFQSVAAQFNQL